MLTVILVSGIFAGDFVRASETPNEKFQKDLESLFGASVQTKHGKMSVRQRTDALGRVRKQIIVGPGFSEIQLDQDGDGTVDFWEVSQGNKTVVASDPNRGRFLRLAITDRGPRGLHESTYLLDLNSRSYNLLKRTFIGKSVKFNLDTADGFEPVDDTPASFPSGVVPSVVAAASASSSRIELDEVSPIDQKMMDHQATILGESLFCESPDSLNNRLAALQRDWWKILKSDGNDRVDRLTTMIGDSKMFASSCKTKERAKDFEALAKGVATVMVSSSKGEPMSTDKTRGRFLRCLEKSGLGVTAARMEKSFLSGINDPYRTETMIKCDWKPGQAGRLQPAQANPYLQQVTVHMCLADEGKGKTAAGSPVNYANTMFHELMHVAGVVDEDMVLAAQACCGDPTDTRALACEKLDVLVGKNLRYQELETHMSRVGDQLAPFISQLEVDFGAEAGGSLYRAFLVGLDNYKKGAPPKGEFENGLVSDVEFAKCRAENGTEFCKAKWQKAIADYTNSFFPKECRKIVPGTKQFRSQCRAFSKELVESVASAIGKSLIDNPQSYAATETPSNPDSKPDSTPTTGSGLPTGGVSVPGACPDRGVVQRRSFFKGVQVTPSSASNAYRRLARLLFGNSVQADPEDCKEAIGVTTPVVAPPQPPAVAAGPGIPDHSEAGASPYQNTMGDSSGTTQKPAWIKVPNETVVNQNNGTSDRTTGSVGRSPSRVAERGSTIPVTRVESTSDSRSFAETRYRRATDFVGASTRGFDRIRNAIVPTAVAGESGSNSSRNRLRLGPKDQFVAFTPEKGEKVVAKLDNPFAVSRDIASIDTAALIHNPSKASAPTAAGSSAGSSSGSGAAMPESGNRDMAARLGRGAKVDAGSAGQSANLKVTSSSSMSTSGRSGALANGKNLSGLSKSQRDLLAGLFTLPYKQIASRLRQLEVVEALVTARISVQDAQGHLLGSRQATAKYIYNGNEVPLRLKSEKE